MTRIHLVSDVHRWDNEILWTQPWPDVDIVIIAGDIESPVFLREQAESRPDIKFFVLLGNHDFWKRQLGYETVKWWQEQTDGVDNLHVYEKDIVAFGNCVFFFTTLWSPISPVNERFVKNSINCFRRIRVGNGRAKPHHTTAEFHKSRDWLLQAAKDTTIPETHKKIFVTHNQPLNALTEQIERKCDPLNEYYSAGLDHQFSHNPALQPDLWFYGHTHERIDRVIGPTRFIQNAYGYDFVENKQGMVKGYDPNLVIEV